MKQKGKGCLEKNHETCDVWLDTSALKRRKKQIQTWKPLRTAKQTFPCSISRESSSLCTKQTTIPTFFRVQREEKKTIAQKMVQETASNSMSVVKEHALLNVKIKPLSASPLQTGIAQEDSQQPGHNSQSLPVLLRSSACARATNNTHFPFFIKENSCFTDRGNPLLDFSQGLEEKMVPDNKTVSSSPRRNENRDRKRDVPRTSQTNQHLKALSKKRTKVRRGRRYLIPYSDSSFMDSCDSENINPQLQQSLVELSPLKSCSSSAVDLCLKNSSAIHDGGKGQDNHQEDSLNPSLFTQDSEGQRVISHRCFQGRDKLSLQNKLLWDTSNLLMNPREGPR